MDQLLANFTHQLPNGVNFRSVELEATSGYEAQHILNACANTLENLTISPSDPIGTPWLSFLSSGAREYSTNFIPAGDSELRSLTLAGVTVLRRLTFRMTFPQGFFFDRALFRETLSTITSPVFREFAVELREPPSPRLALEYLSRWEEIDKLLEEQFAKHGNFKVIIRMGNPCDQEFFRRHAKEGFPFLARRGCVGFDVSRNYPLP